MDASHTWADNRRRFVDLFPARQGDMHMSFVQPNVLDIQKPECRAYILTQVHNN